MISLTKLLTKILESINTINTELIIVENKTTSNDETINSDAWVSITIDVTKSGYTPIGIVGVSINGIAAEHCFCSLWQLSENTISLRVKNTYNYPAICRPTISVLYRKNN